MARKTCWDCKTRPVSNNARADLCDVCLEYADHENTHTDDDHEGGNETPGYLMKDCMVCHPELDNRNPKIGHTNTVAKSRTSHAGCDHPLTPKARAACRKARTTRDVNKPRCTCGGNEATDGPVFIHSHKCSLKGTPAEIVHNKDKIRRAEANMKKANSKATGVTDVTSLPMPKLTPAQLASPTFRSMLRKG
jgi:hypothetical protein